MAIEQTKVSARKILGIFRGRLWKASHREVLWNQISDPQQNQRSGLADHDHLLAAAGWLEAAQDATGDGGVCGRYALKSGWTSSYPETTGYIVPTFLALAEQLGVEQFRHRAGKAVDFLLGVQLDSGAFPGLEIAHNANRPSPFNSAQIIHGLIAWHAATGDEKALNAALRAADWLISVQDKDGAFRKYFFGSLATTYSAHLSCWLAELGKYTGKHRFLTAAEHHLDWVLDHRNTETGWIDLAGFDEQQHKRRIAFTHTIAYTFWGILHTSVILERADGVDAVRHAAARIARRQELSKMLPGILDAEWKKQASFACLTGNAQMALIWFRLYEMEHDEKLLNAALNAIELIKKTQPMNSRNPGINGGVAGSFPIWGDYISMAIPNWAAKYFVDALLKKNEILGIIDKRPRLRYVTKCREIRAQLPDSKTEEAGRSKPRVVLYTSPHSQKVAQMLTAWDKWGFMPDCVVISSASERSFIDRLLGVLRAEGVRGLLDRVRPSNIQNSGSESSQEKQNPRSFCAARSIPILEVSRLSDPKSLREIRNLAPDLAIYAGAGILRSPLLSIPTLGTVNAHMGVLPHYRGMNVAEWAYFNGDPVGCSVHLIDPGIDTGDILATSIIESHSVTSIHELRARVDEAQIELLGDVVRYVLSSGTLPLRYPQRTDEGTQYFRMHSDLVAIIERDMQKSVTVHAKK